jgi:hypothetical protein
MYHHALAYAGERQLGQPLFTPSPFKGLVVRYWASDTITSTGKSACATEGY